MRKVPVLQYWVDPALGRNHARASVALQQLLELGGWRSALATDREHADVVYGHALALPNALPCAGLDPWNSLDAQKPARYKDYRVPVGSLIGESAMPVVDPVLAAYFFLSGRIEHDSHQRVFPGIPERDSIAEWRLDAVPAVQRLVEALATHLPNLPPPQPRWPHAKRWALCLSHDCDRLLRFRTRGFARDVVRSGSSIGERAASAAKAAYVAVRRPAGIDPYEASALAWLQFERSMNVRGTYFIGTWSRYDSPSDPQDLGYSPTDPETLRLAHSCREQGAEISLHSSIGAWRGKSRYAEEVRRFKQSFGVAPQGVRGHYWSLNPDRPEESLAFAACHGGLKYDTSLGMNVALGFRRGTCYPFRPFRPETGEYSGLWELPPSVMDGALHASAATNDARVANLIDLADSVKNSEGVLVIDWHSDSLWEGFMDNMTLALLPALANMIADSSCWVATGNELIGWCSDARWKEAK